MNLTLISAAVAAAVGFGAAWQIQGHFLIKQELNYANERIAIQRQSRVALERATSAITKAQNDAAGRAVVLRQSADAARTELDGLRDATTASLRSAGTSLAACINRTTAFADVLIASSKAYSDLAATCDRHVNDLRTLIESQK